MTLEQTYFLSQIAASICITISLIFVGLQVRQNRTLIQSQNDAMRIQNMRQRAAEQRAVLSMQATPETIERAVEKAYRPGEQLSGRERNGMEAYLVAFILLAECDYKLHRDGLLGSEDWLPSRAQLKLLLLAPFAREWFEKVGHVGVSEGFRNEVEAVCREAQEGVNPYMAMSTTDRTVIADA